MDIANIILEFTKILIWPIVVFIAILIFKDNLKDFFKRLVKMNVLKGELEAESQQHYDNNNEKAEKIIEEADIEEIKKQYEKKESQIQEEASVKIKKLSDELVIKDIQLDFERIYNKIFGSQIRLLEDMTRKKLLGATEMYLKNQFFLTQIKYPIHKKYTLSDYLKFLIDSKLIEASSGQYFKISKFGELFLGYINDMGYIKDKGL